MALTPGENAFLGRVRTFAQLFRSQYGDISIANALYYGQLSNFNAALTDEDIQSLYPDLTKAEIDEVMYIVGQLKGLIDARVEQIAAVAG